MRYVNVVVSLLVAVAALVAAYAVGLLVRQARMPDTPPVAVATPNDVGVDPVMAIRPGPDGARVPPDEAGAEIKKQRAEILEKAAAMTEEQKQQFRDKMRTRLAPRTDRGRSRNLGGDDRQRALEQWQNLSPQEKETLTAEMQQRYRMARPRQDAAPGDASPGEQAGGEQDAAQSSPEPNESGQVND